MFGTIHTHSPTHSPTQINMTTLNFPPNLSKNCMSNPDSENYGSGCQKWTVGSNGNPNFPMTYSNWINDPGMSNPNGWPRPDATSDSISYVPPTASCINNQIRPQAPSLNYSIPWNTYSNLGNYSKSMPFNFNLPIPGGTPPWPACCSTNKLTKEKIYTNVFKLFK